MADSINNVASMEQAEALCAEGKWDEAKALYLGMLEANPADADLWQRFLDKANEVGDFTEVVKGNMALAEVLAQNGEYDRARSLYQDVISLEQQAKSGEIAGHNDVLNKVSLVKAELFCKLGYLDIWENKADKAIEWLRASLDLDPSRWDTHMGMGQVYMALNRDKDAIGEFQEVVRLAPNEAAFAYEMLGEIFIRIGRTPQSTMVWFRNAGELFMQKGSAQDAMRTYRRILSFEPHNKDVLVRLASIFADEQMLEDAAQIYGTLAELYEKEGITDKVIYYYERLLECSPENQAARENLMRIYADVLQVSPNNVQLRARLADCLMWSGRYEEAAEHKMYLARGCQQRDMLDECYGFVVDVLQYLPNHIEARLLLAELYKRRDMNTEALAEYQAVVQLYYEAGNEIAALDLQHQLAGMFPEASDLKYQVTLTLRSQGDREGAINELKRILNENPDDMVARGYMGEEYAALGRWDEAIQVYREMLNVDPARTEIRKRLIKHSLEVGNYSEALEDINCLAADDVDRMGFFYRIVDICIQQEKYDDAEHYLGQLSEDDEHLLAFRKVLLSRYLEGGDVERAEAMAPLIPRNDKDRVGLVSNLLEQHMNAGRLEMVANFIECLPEDDVLRVTFRRRLIAAYQETGRLDEARVELTKLPFNDELQGELMTKQISALLDSGRMDDAMTEIKNLPEGSPARNSFMGKLIEAHLQNGNIDKAAEEVAKLTDSSEIVARYRRRLVQAYLNANRLDDAQRDILALEGTDPEKVSFLRLLLQKYEASGDLDRVRELALNLPDNMSEKQQYLEGVAHSYLASGDLATARQEVYNMAEALAVDGDHYEAENLYTKLLNWHPADVDIRLRICQEQAAQGKLDRAREGMLVLAGRFHCEGNITSAADIYTRLLDIDPENLNARYRLGDIWAEQGQTAQALEQFAKLAKVYLQQNLPEVAQRVLHRILELDPRDVVHRRQLIQLLTRNLRFEEATDHHRRLLEIYLERGELEEARSCVREIVTLQPLNLDMRQTLGEMFLNSGFLEEGQGLMEELASTYKGRGDHDNVVKVFTTLSTSFENNNQWDTALEYTERVADEQVEADNWEAAQRNYIKALKEYILRGRKENADPLFVRLIDGFFRHRNVPQGVKLLESVQSDFVEQGHLDLALVVKDRLAGIMERQSEWQQALEILKEISQDYLSLGDSDQAILYCRRAADLALHNGMVPYGIELLYQLMGMILSYRSYEAALGVMEELRQHVNGDIKKIERLGDILFLQGLLDKARDVYDEVLAVDPTSVGALSRIAVIYARDGKMEQVSSIARRVVTNGLVGQVVDEYAAVMGEDATSAMFHIRLGEFYRQIGFLDEAIREFDLASKEPTCTLEAVNHLAQAFSLKGYNSLAIRQLDRTLNMPGFEDEELLELRYNLAKIFEQEGRLKEALQAYQECFAIDIDFRDVADRVDYLFDKVDVATYNSDVFNYDDEL